MTTQGTIENEDQRFFGEESRLDCWNLGLELLLQGREFEAQLAWSMELEEADSQSIRVLCQKLLNEAFKQEQLGEYQLAWAIRQYLREFDPNDIDNLIQIIYLSLHLNIFDSEILNQLKIVELIQSPLDNSSISESSMVQLAQNILASDLEHDLILKVINLIIPHVRDIDFIVKNVLAPAASRFNNVSLDMSVQIFNLCLLLIPHNQEILGYLTDCYLKHRQYSQALIVAQEAVNLCNNPIEAVLADFCLSNALITTGGMWDQVLSVFQHQTSLLALLKQHDRSSFTSHLFISRFFAPYISDDPKATRTYQNYLSSLCQERLQHIYEESFKEFTNHNLTKLETKNPPILKIGYLSNCLGTHSVGWLTRWLFKYHDRSKFKIYGYFLNYYQAGTDPLQEWFIDQVDIFYRVGIELSGNVIEICNQIMNDEIDILVDLDSITYMNSCEILALKPAPIQVSWLGFDASGIPAVDYFIADSYVLPTEAELYYSEKIWRLPHSYIAVEGFECGERSLYREDLEIAEDAVIFFTGQTGYKRNPDTIRLQLKIIRNVPNSYLLIKGLSDSSSIQKLFLELAEEEGVSIGQLRFLPLVNSEFEHRANLAIADVVLDTFPYNGATTTLETLWMGIPIITLVGKQFAARNSYTMMINAGIDEGISWSPEEYINWGVKFGTDKQLRDKVSQKLKKSQKSSPLWNAIEFTKEIESAYRGMWQTTSK